MSKSEQTVQVLFSLLLGTCLAGISVTIALYFQWVTEINLLELFAVATSYACTYLCVVQSRWNYPLAMITTLSYTILFYQWGLYGSALASLYVPFAIIYGWFRWGPDGDTRAVTFTKLKHYPAYLLLGLIGWGITFYVADQVGATLPLMDSAILVLTIIAQFMMDNKKIENWCVWAVLNVIAIALYFQSGLYLAGLQYVFFLGNTVFGAIMWWRSMRHPNTMENAYAV